MRNWLRPTWVELLIKLYYHFLTVPISPFILTQTESYSQPRDELKHSKTQFQSPLSPRLRQTKFGELVEQIRHAKARYGLSRNAVLI